MAKLEKRTEIPIDEKISCYLVSKDGGELPELNSPDDLLRYLAARVGNGISASPVLTEAMRELNAAGL